MIIAIDPGSVNTGVAMFTYNESKRKANLVFLKILHGEEVQDLINILRKNDAKHIVVIEDFKNAMATGNFRNKRSAKMSHHELMTHELAKKLKVTAAANGHDLVVQEPRILSMATKWCDMSLPKGHIPDDKSAYIHGAHYMMECGKIDSVDDILKFGQERMT